MDAMGCVFLKVLEICSTSEKDHQHRSCEEVGGTKKSGELCLDVPGSREVIMANQPTPPGPRTPPQK